MKFQPTCLLILLTIATFANDARAKGEVTQIKLQHTQCDGPCPIDELTLNADGSAQFAGMSGEVVRKGFYRGQIAPEKFAALARALEQQNFFELRPDLGNSMTTDSPDAIVSAMREGSFLDKPYTVVFEASANRVLLDKLEAAFAEASAQIDWKKDEVATLSGVRGTLRRDLTPHETELFADRKPAFTSLTLPYALIQLILSGRKEGEAEIVYSTHSDGEGKYQIFAPPGRYLFSSNDFNAAYSLDHFQYFPRWWSNGMTIEVQPNQFSAIERQISDTNEATQ